jgi:hypothetical protein
LDLKWRFIPRFAFYFNLFLYLLFLTLFAVYSYQLSSFYNEEFAESFKETSKSPPNATAEQVEDKTELEVIQSLNNDTLSSGLRITLLIVIFCSLAKKLFQIILIDRLSFFSSMQNWAEITSYVLALIAVGSNDLDTKLSISSLALLLSFIVFSFLIQKLRVFGLYVLAFRRTLSNSAKFFPM